NGGEQEGLHHDLFSMVASDNAEVVPPDAPRGPDSMWSVAANAALPGDAHAGSADAHVGSADAASGVADPWVHGDGVAGDDGPPPFDGWRDTDDERDRAEEQPLSNPFRRGPDSVGSVFSAEPVDHYDVVDEADGFEDPTWTVDAASEGSLFSNGSHLRDGAPRPGTNGSGPSAAGPAAWTEDPWVERQDAWEPAGAEWDPRGAEWWDQSQSDAQDVHHDTTQPRAADPLLLDDPQGYDTAILRLHPTDRERAHVPLSVCGALLHEHEMVRGVVTGQMLGRPAAVVVTDERVLIVNDRRRQPVVDNFPIYGDLVVRGRHDRQIAALSFADPTRVSMVDGIGEVEIAIELAEHIRDAGPRGDG
ncbi:MAG: hypothetical protein ACYC2O_11765, partial [Microthrixaceae bacterium]